jgi:hypothetical protein
MTVAAAVPPRESAFRWFIAPSDRPLSPLWVAIVLLFALNCLWLLAPLRRLGLFPTGPWGLDTRVGDVNFAIQLAVMAVGLLALSMAPPRFAKAILAVEGCACLTALGPFFCLASVAALTLWFYALRIPIPHRARLAIPIVLLLAAGIFGASKIAKGPFAFSMLFGLRLIRYAWDQHQHDYPARSPVDFFTYMLAPPLVFTFPYMLFIPAPKPFVASLSPRLSERRARRALFQLALAFVMIGITVGMAKVIPQSTSRFLRMYQVYVFEIVEIARLAHLVFALLLLHGFDTQQPINAPLLATNFVEMWHRYTIHQKDLQMTLFYAPALIALRRKNRYLAICGAVAWTLFFGNMVVHVLVRYMYNPSRWAPLVTARLIFFGVGTLVLAATLCLQEWRRRTRRVLPKGIIGHGYTAICWAGTQTLTAWLMTL